jgi:hypothetical protein
MYSQPASGRSYQTGISQSNGYTGEFGRGFMRRLSFIIVEFVTIVFWFGDIYACIPPISLGIISDDDFQYITKDPV